MSIKDSYVNKIVAFDTRDSLQKRLDRLMTMVSKLTAQDNGQNEQFKLKTYQGKRRDRQ